MLGAQMRANRQVRDGGPRGERLEKRVLKSGFSVRNVATAIVRTMGIGNDTPETGGRAAGACAAGRSGNEPRHAWSSCRRGPQPWPHRQLPCRARSRTGIWPAGLRPAASLQAGRSGQTHRRPRVPTQRPILRLPLAMNIRTPLKSGLACGNVRKKAVKKRT
jgi:hypothetical protein